jgi:hypothetical protein
MGPASSRRKAARRNGHLFHEFGGESDINVNANTFRRRIAEASPNSVIELFFSIERASIQPSSQNLYTSTITLLK